jgi:predicted dehydrogenase
MASYPVPEGLDWDAWLGPMPPRGYHPELYAPRAKPGWISIMPYSGGEVTGWGAHGLDMIQWALGTDDTGPVEIWTEGNPRKLDRVVHMKYENGIELVMDNQGPQGGGRFMGSEGSLVVDRGRYETDPSSLGDVNEEELAVQLPNSSNHQQNFLDCVRSRERPIADVEIGHRSTVLCHMMNIARWAQRSLQWDPVNEQFVDDEAANEYLDRPRREPWQLPTV